MPPLLPPWEVNGERYIDGGTVTPLPLRVAWERGATEIYSLHITTHDTREKSTALYRGVASLLTRSVDTMLNRQAEHDLLLVKHQRKVKLHHLELKVTDPPAPNDFTQVEQLIALGYEQTQAYLTALSPQRLPRPIPQGAVQLSPVNFVRRFRQVMQRQAAGDFLSTNNHPWLHRFWSTKADFTQLRLPRIKAPTMPVATKNEGTA